MAACFSAWSGANARPVLPHRHALRCRTMRWQTFSSSSSSSVATRMMASSSSSSSENSSSTSTSTSYLDMWKKAMERDRRAQVLGSLIVQQDSSPQAHVGEESLERRTEEFQRILQVPPEERDRVQRLQVIDRAAAAIAAAQALLEDKKPPLAQETLRSGGYGPGASQASPAESEFPFGEALKGEENMDSLSSELEPPELGTPGPNFWSWSPPQDITGRGSLGTYNFKTVRKVDVKPSPSFMLMEKERSAEVLPIPFESTLEQGNQDSVLPSLQSVVELEQAAQEAEITEMFSRNAEEAAEALGMNGLAEASTQGVNLDGTKWWKETGTETRADGVVCKWTLIRGVSADGAIEWEDKYWEASDQFDYKELGSEKSGRDAFGNVWREFWKESMWQDLKTGLVNMEKTADKWGKDTRGSEWHEKWWEHYDASGQAEKWAHKWCQIDPNTPLDAGHAHTWHERWGEKYDGKGASIKYTDKWAERCEGDGWSKWGDKWDENFDQYGCGVKQGETWWEGKYGDHWNRTWGEGHNGSGWIHKYGKSSSGEHWDTHEQQETWYERQPHFGFDHCFRNSVQLRGVPKPNKGF